jgi:hypothetical protein
MCAIGCESAPGYSKQGKRISFVHLENWISKSDAVDFKFKQDLNEDPSLNFFEFRNAISEAVKYLLHHTSAVDFYQIISH